MDFDPYEKWLGIPRDRRPPTHYDLLGLAPFESDPSAIEQAALRRIARVRQHQIGPRSDQSQEILSELARARLILMDPDRRGEYDAKLREDPGGLSAVNGSTGRPGKPDAKPVLRRTVEAVPDALASMVITGLETDGSLTLRPSVKRASPVWTRYVLRVLFMAMHAALLACAYVFVYRPWTAEPEPAIAFKSDPVPPAPRPRPTPARPPAVRPQAPKPLVPDNPPKPPSPPEEPFEFAHGQEDRSRSPDQGSRENGQPGSRSEPTVIRKQPGRPLTSKQQSDLRRAENALKEAKDRYSKRKRSAETNLSAAFENAMKMIRKNPNISPADREIWLGQLRTERDSYQNRQQIPRSPLMIDSVIKYQTAVYKALLDVMTPYNALIKRYSEFGRSEEALELANELKDAEREVTKADLFVAGSYWQGQRFVDPDNAAVPFALRVLEVRGTSFTGEATFGGAVAHVSGQFNGFQVRFTTDYMLRGPDKKWNIAGLVLGDELWAFFEGVNRNDKGDQYRLTGRIQLGLQR